MTKPLPAPNAEPLRIAFTPAQRAQFERLVQQKQAAEDRLNVFCDGILLGHVEADVLAQHIVSVEDGALVLRPSGPRPTA